MTLEPQSYCPEHFLWHYEKGIATITLNRPARKNPLAFESYAELRDPFRALPYCRKLRALVMTGAGDNFSSGGDVHEIIGHKTKVAGPCGFHAHDWRPGQGHARMPAATPEFEGN